MEKQNMNKVFKQVLKAFFVEVMDLKTVADDIEANDTYGDLMEVLSDNIEEINKKLNADCPYCDDKEKEIKELEDDKDSAEDALEELQEDFNELKSEIDKSFCPQTLDELYKLEAFKRNINKFSLSEFESLLD